MGKGTLFGPHFHEFDLILKSMYVINLVGLTGLCRKQRLRRVGVEYHCFPNVQEAGDQVSRFEIARSRSWVQVPRWISYILATVLNLGWLAWHRVRSPPRISRGFPTSVHILYKSRGFLFNRSERGRGRVFLLHKQDIRRSTQFCKCANT